MEGCFFFFWGGGVSFILLFSITRTFLQKQLEAKLSLVVFFLTFLSVTVVFTVILLCPKLQCLLKIRKT